uniref:Uncharacterized protein n=2 Tax=Oryza TaxID=4527 RepID=A0A0E0N6X6_ORYRU
MAMGAAAASIRDGELPPGDRPRRRVDPREPYSSRHPRRSRFRPLASLGGDVTALAVPVFAALRRRLTVRCACIHIRSREDLEY